MKVSSLPNRQHMPYGTFLGPASSSFLNGRHIKALHALTRMTSSFQEKSDRIWHLFMHMQFHCEQPQPIFLT
ncbi:hypothetical protein MPTK1_4g15180 [Marchantia polymorpha subsp. ruderalis]|uniref:Uncharacterized protein n=2 Tax=Marchantia polymorpha TaxID=3197 RepID=A0AAF6BA42_MARPO|nr:hypothetical protein MARPO_0119s0042 [Marchantia polymorpha]BBN08876.1 hypothetical protein Mp_4g15180 [Marchantia polymorpha subsp. ruderalis]|eukprot:PTQ30842.1 hypothetical protein MARPO_0119s0042 [Marchantia polymorpha]